MKKKSVKPESVPKPVSGFRIGSHILHNQDEEQMRFYFCILQSSLGHFKKTDLIFLKCSNNNFIGSIDILRHVATLLHSIDCYSKVSKGRRIGFQKLAQHIEQNQIAGNRSQSLWIAKCILNGKFHIQQSHLLSSIHPETERYYV